VTEPRRLFALTLDQARIAREGISHAIDRGLLDDNDLVPGYRTIDALEDDQADIVEKEVHRKLTGY
jgi:hypothetical protein